MAPRSNALPALVRGAVCLGALALVVFAAAGCGDDDNGKAAPSPVASSPEAKGTPGAMTVESSSPIVGQQGKQLAIFATAKNGASPIARACVRITSDSFTVPATPLTEIGTNQDACSATTTAVLPKGSYTIVAGIYTLPASALEKQTAQTVEVTGDAQVKVKIDGAALSR
jgi:hypothetical protein